MALPKRITNKRQIDPADVLDRILNHVAVSSDRGDEFEVCETILLTAAAIAGYAYQKHLANMCRDKSARQDAERHFMRSAIDGAMKRCWR